MQPVASRAANGNASPAVLVIESENPAELALYRQTVARAAPLARITTAASEAEALAAPADTTIIFSKAQCLPHALLERLPQLAWIHSLTTGIDRILAGRPRADIVITCARGIHGPQMTELALLLMLSLLRGFPQVLRNQAARVWDRRPQPLLTGRTIGIVGLGAIAAALAPRCQSFGMRVIGVSDSRRTAPGCDEVRPRTALAEVAGQVDFLLLLVPLQDATRHLVDARVLRAMRPTSYLLNLARGPVVEESALVEALRAGRIAGAALDVFDIEPLPASSLLWDLPNVIITPHVGGFSAVYGEQNLPLLDENLRAWVAGEPAAMRNIVAGPLAPRQP